MIIISRNVTQTDDNYKYPPMDLLSEGDSDLVDAQESNKRRAKNLKKILALYGAYVEIIKVESGFNIYRIEFKPIKGTRIRDILSLREDISFQYGGRHTRIEKLSGSMIAEIACENNKTLKLGALLNNDGVTNELRSRSGSFVLGLGFEGKTEIGNLMNFNGILLTGCTGCGKTTFIHSFLISLLMNNSPEKVKIAILGSEVLKGEYKQFDGLPHLMLSPSYDSDRSIALLEWIYKERERRYKLISEKRVYDIKKYNLKMMEENPEEVLPRIVLIIDEIVELLMHNSKKITTILLRLLQGSKGAGIHIIYSTQCPDYIDPLLSINTSDHIMMDGSECWNSETDFKYPVKLPGFGEMIYEKNYSYKRLHCPIVYEDEMRMITDYIKKNNSCESFNLIGEEIDNMMVDSDSENSEHEEVCDTHIGSDGAE